MRPILWSLLALMVGCTTIRPLGSHDAAPSPDAAVVPVECGPTTCAIGAVCCNESCGVCTLPGSTCLDTTCTDAGIRWSHDCVTGGCDGGVAAP